MTTREHRPTAGDGRADRAFIPEPRRINPVLRAANALADRDMGVRFVPGRLMAWDPRTALAWALGSLHWFLPRGRARRVLGQRIEDLVAITAAHTVGSPYCIADTVGGEPMVSEREIAAIRTAADLSASPRSRRGSGWRSGMRARSRPRR